MALTPPTNVHNNTPAYILDDKNYVDPLELLALVQSREGAPQMILDQVWADCQALTRDSWMGFIDMFQMSIGFNTNSIQFVEHQTPDYVLYGVGAVARAGNVFTIDYDAVDGWETGDDAFFYRVDDVVAVIDDTGKREMGVITVVDKAGSSFTAVARDGASWTVAAADLTIDVTGSDFDKASCGPEGMLEQRKTKTSILKMQELKDAIEYTGQDRYAFCFSDGEVMWYDENTVALKRRLNTKVAKTLMLDTESKAGSGAYLAGKYGTKGLFQKIQEEGLLQTGYITTKADMQAITAYYDSLGLISKEFTIHCDRAQYRLLETLASTLGTSLNLNINVNFENTPNNMMKFGFSGFVIDGYTFHFSKWDLTDANSPLGRPNYGESLPKGIIMPMGTVKTKINGVDRQVPYIFKAYEDMTMKPGVVRNYFTGGFAPTPTNDCETYKHTVATTVGLGIPCPEVVGIII